MKTLNSGRFSGETRSSRDVNDIVLTEVEYQIENVDWHCHQNAFFSFIQRGVISEVNKKGKYSYGAGTVLFRQAGEPHYNPQLKNQSAALYIEIKPAWIKRLEINLEGLPKFTEITNPDIRILFHRLNLESKTNNTVIPLSVEELLIHMITGDPDKNFNRYSLAPGWIAETEEVLRSGFPGKLTLAMLSREVDVHPVHLCKYFRKYVGCTISEYVRKLRIEKSLGILLKDNGPLTDVAYACGFSDQSHFSRNFKEMIGTTPLQYRKMMGNGVRPTLV
ncbi:MAG: helix-turn-helix transcriptional regulator [Bacteroidetes bacterium]|nr:helix-turn-helix transcriptional regulator [Bacteroidota bacterium]